MSTVISIENLWKEYRLGVLGYRSFQQDMQSRWARLRGRPDPNAPISVANGGNSFGERIWALKGVSLEVKQGEVLGIIGRNGAGKSTLLKILSRITAPTKGEVKIRGRVASLLEVGTGFHPELTGRENVFLNGTILGMTVREIQRKFDEIVDFSGVEKFIDTPVKRYSSGMYVRLAFAVAAHLESEILIVDEILSVGDAEFQKKCIGKMATVATQGRTVLFVSHNLNAVERLCNSALLLQFGEVQKVSNDTQSIVREYLLAQGDKEWPRAEWSNEDGLHFRNRWMTPIRFYAADREGQIITEPVPNDREILICVDVDILEENPALEIGYSVYADDGTVVYWSLHTDGQESLWPRLTKGRCALRSAVPERFLNEGDYRIELISSLRCVEWLLEPGRNGPGISLSIRGGLSESPYWLARRPGIMAPVIRWMNS